MSLIKKPIFNTQFNSEITSDSPDPQDETDQKYKIRILKDYNPAGEPERCVKKESRPSHPAFHSTMHAFFSQATFSCARCSGAKIPTKGSSTDPKENAALSSEPTERDSRHEIDHCNKEDAGGFRFIHAGEVMWPSALLNQVSPRTVAIDFRFGVIGHSGSVYAFVA